MDLPDLDLRKLLDSLKSREDFTSVSIPPHQLIDILTELLTARERLSVISDGVAYDAELTRRSHEPLRR